MFRASAAWERLGIAKISCSAPAPSRNVSEVSKRHVPHWCRLGTSRNQRLGVSGNRQNVMFRSNAVCERP
eukprot:2684917-Pyramimonas_sp.AAC.1